MLLLQHRQIRTNGLGALTSTLVPEKTFLGSTKSGLTFAGFKYFSHTTNISADSNRDAAGFQT